MNMAGFDRVVGTAVEVTLTSGLVVPVAPLSLYALLKLVAYTDRKQEKDLEAVEHLLRHYAGDDERRWGLAHEDKLVEYDYGPAYLLGIDGTKFIAPDLSERLRPLLISLSEASTGSLLPETDYEEWRPRREDLFFWYRRGLQL